MEDYNRVLEATSVAENANGVAAEKMTVYNESLEAAQNRLTASVQQFAQDSNLDRTLALAYDGLSKVVEILNILLNKIPVLSPLIKAMGVALATAFAGNVLKNMWETSNLIGQLPSLAATTTSAIGALNTTLFTIGSVSVPIWGVVAAIAAIGGVAKIAWDSWKNSRPEEQVKRTTQALEESQQELDSAKKELDEINKQIKEIDSRGTLTLADEQEKKKLEDQREVLQQIYDYKKKINEENEKQLKTDTSAAMGEKYSAGVSGFDEAYQKALENRAKREEADKYISTAGTGPSEYYNVQSASVAELTSNIRLLTQEQEKLRNTEGDNGGQLEANNQKLQENINQLREKAVAIGEDIAKMQDMGLTDTDAYKNAVEQWNQLQVYLDPSNFEKLSLGNLIDTSGFEDKIKEAVQAGDDAGKETAEGYARTFAEQILRDDQMKEAWAQAMNIDVSELNTKNIDVLIQEILTKFQQMFGQISDDANTASQGFINQNQVLEAYQNALNQVHDSTTDLTAAYQDMIDKGYVSESVVKKLTEAHPELVKELKLENGQYKINIETLKEANSAEIDKAINSIKAEKEQTEKTIELIKKRVDALQAEAAALLSVAEISGDEKSYNRYVNKQREIGDLMTRLNQLSTAATKADESINKLEGYKENWSPTSKKSKSSGTSAADKAAKEFENSIKEKIKNLKSIVELYSEQTDWDDPAVIQKFTDNYNKLFNEVINNPEARKILADSYNLDISEMSNEEAIKQLTLLWQKQAGTIDEARQKLQENYLKNQQEIAKQQKENFDNAKKQIEELNKMTTNMIKTYVGLLEKAGNLVFDLLGKVSDRYDKQIDNLDKIMDDLDDQKDAFDDKIDAQKEYLKLQKEEMDNEDKLAEKTKSIADIDARLIELQYDDSAAAQAERLKLLDQRAEAEKDLKDLQEEQAYDAKINALDAQKKQFDKDIETQKKALEEQKKALEESQTKFENTLNKIKSGFDGFIKVLNSDIFQNLAANLLNSIDGDTLKQALYSWNRLFGSGIDADVTNILQAYGTAGKYGWTPGKNMQDFLNMFTQGSNTQQQILDQVEQAISSNKAGNLDISGYKNNIDFLNKSWDSFKQNAIDSVTQVGESSQSVVKNLWDFGNKMLNQESASGNGVVRTIAKGISTTIKSGKKGISTFLQQGIQANQALGISGQGILSQVGNFAQGIMKLVGGSGGGILNTVLQFGSTLLGKVSGISSQLVKGIGTVGGGAINTIASVGGKALSSIASVASGIFGSSATAGITSMIPTLGSAAGGAAGLAGLGASGGLIGLAVAGGALLSSGIKSNLKNLWGSNKSFGKKVLGTALNFLTPVGWYSGIKKLFGRHHSGADYVKKQNPMLDKMLGLGSDETVSILKVGEAVVPTWANSANRAASNSNYTGTATQAVRTAQQTSRVSSSTNNNNNSVVNTISVPINIQGNADESTVKLLREESDRIAKTVFKLINKQTNMSGYRNIKAATV
nr:MAG TPA: chromosome segregation ATPase [Caudoviricetes sp.]